VDHARGSQMELLNHLQENFCKIHGCYQNKSTFPCVFSFLPGKSRQTYRHLFNCMELAAEEYKIELKPKKFFVDFEAAAINDFKLAWPSAEIKGCFFHFAKAILRKAVELGLKQQYEKNEKDFQKWLKFFMGFAFLSLDELDEAFEELKTEYLLFYLYLLLYLLYYLH